MANNNSNTGTFFYAATHEAIKELPAEMRGEMYEKILDYAIYDIEPEFPSGIMKALFIAIKPIIDAKKRDVSNGRKGGRPRKEKAVGTDDTDISTPFDDEKSILEKGGFENEKRGVSEIEKGGLADSFQNEKPKEQRTRDKEQSIYPPIVPPKPEKGGFRGNEKKPHESIPYREIVDFLNEKTHKSYRYNTGKTKSLIASRWREGFNLQDFQAVIDKKARDWINTEYEKFLRPETLFGNKFEGYLQESAPKKQDYNPFYGENPKEKIPVRIRDEDL